jgi:hypothetical protein
VARLSIDFKWRAFIFSAQALVRTVRADVSRGP